MELICRDGMHPRPKCLSVENAAGRALLPSSQFVPPRISAGCTSVNAEAIAVPSKNSFATLSNGNSSWFVHVRREVYPCRCTLSSRPHLRSKTAPHCLHKRGTRHNRTQEKRGGRKATPSRCVFAGSVRILSWP